MARGHRRQDHQEHQPAHAGNVTLATLNVNSYTLRTRRRQAQEELPMPNHDPTRRIPITALMRYYLRLGLLGFSGPIALVGQMEREMVTKRGWITKEEM